MLINYLRSSSYNQFDFCQMQYYINYVLGVPNPAGKSADKGTCVHKVMEVLANCKKSKDNNIYEYDDDALGLITWDEDSFFKPEILSDTQITTINKTRINKYNYKHDCQLQSGFIRYGTDFVNSIIEKSIHHYSNTDWTNADKKDCENWSWMALEYKDGIFDPRKKNIVAAEPHFDLSFDFDDQHFFIRGTIDLITSPKSGILEIIDWKGLPVDTEIPIPDGWTTIGNLQIGDIVFDEDGKKTKIIGKSKPMIKPCYKITFDDKTEAICDNEHLWKLYDGTTIDITRLKVCDKISITKPLSLPNIDLPIDPYVLGVWLGDGRNSNGEICGVDGQIFDKIISRGYKLGPNINKTNKCPSYTAYGLMPQLRKLNLLNNKHIPPIYLRASYQQRLDLLRGLMDSDGNVNKVRKQCVFTNCNKQLSNDVKELLLTLGQRPNQATITKTGFGVTTIVYPIHFRPININPFYLQRKVIGVDLNWGPGWSNCRRIVKIENVEDTVTQCIMVDSPKHTYLCTKNMIVTHNTGQRIDWVTQQPFKNPKTYKKLCADFQLMLYYYAAVRTYAEYDQIIVTIFWIRDGGPYTICFDNKSIKDVEQKLKNRFLEIKNCINPKMCDPTQNDFKCTKLCNYYKMRSPDGKTNFCQFIKDEIQNVGIDKVTELWTQKDFDIKKYEAPG